MHEPEPPLRPTKRQICRRLFVPLSREPYEWFSSGQKEWEIRKQRGAFSDGQVFMGRPVELRLGYRDASSSFWGTVIDVIKAESLAEIFECVPFEKAIPSANDLDSALSIASKILGVSANQRIEAGIVAFKAQLDGPDVPATCIRMSPAYKELIRTRRKTTTIRRSSRSFRPGRAIIKFSDGEELPVVLTTVTHLAVKNITTRDAWRDGFQSIDDLLTSLRHHYPTLQVSDSVTILEFKWAT